MDYKFKTPYNDKEFNLAENFLLWQNLGYPGYEYWVRKKAIPEAKSGDKKIILAFSDNNLVGDLVYQMHKENPDFLELKNLRVHPLVKDRYFAKFMLRQVEIDNRNKYKAIICDCPANQPEIVRFMESCGYHVLIKKPLYDDNREEIVLLKLLKPSKKSIIIPSALDLFEDNNL